MKLKPCPFCGAEVAETMTCAEAELMDDDIAKELGFDRYYTTVCSLWYGGCGASVCGETKWNRRTTDD